MRFKKTLLSLGFGAALLTGYAGVVFYQAGGLSPEQRNDLALTSVQQPKIHSLLVLAVAEWRDSGLVPATVGMAGGYSADMFEAQEEVQASRTFQTRFVTCIEEGKPPMVSKTVTKGAFAPMEYYGGGAGDIGGETDADFEAFSKKVSQVTLYNSMDGGRTGMTTAVDGNAWWRWLHPKIWPAGTTFTPKPLDGCQRFDESSAHSGALISQVLDSIELQKPWSWTDTSGKSWEWVVTPQNNGRVHLSLQGPTDDIEKVRDGVIAGMSRTGAPTWFDAQFIKHRDDWGPGSRKMSMTTFETKQGHSLTVYSRRLNQDKSELKFSSLKRN